MNPYQTLNTPLLNDVGLNCHAVFNLADLPPEARAILSERCPQSANYRQLLLIAHGGRNFWQALQTAGITSEHPVDDFTVASIKGFFTTEHPDAAYDVIYPGCYIISLQELGKLAGWHHPSPFMVGINATWGSWFAYRAVVLANTDFPVTVPVTSPSPCASCDDKPCISSCPAKALDDGEFHLLKCITYRKQADSACKNTCIARVRCPVAREHRYSKAQIQYHYGRSMKIIRNGV